MAVSNRRIISNIEAFLKENLAANRLALNDFNDISCTIATVLSHANIDVVGILQFKHFSELHQNCGIQRGNEIPKVLRSIPEHIRFM